MALEGYSDNDAETVKGNDIDSDGDGTVDTADDATNVTSTYKGNDIDSNGDGTVDTADDAANVTSTYKGNDIDTDGDGTVDAADDADTVDGQHAADLGITFTEVFSGPAGVEDLWTTHTSPSTGGRLKHAGASVYNGLIYVFGGQNGSGDTDAIRYYNPVTDSWTTVTATLNSGGQGMRAVTYGDKIYVTEGATDQFGVYDPVADSYDTTVSQPGNPHDFGGWAVMNDGDKDIIVAAKGRDSGGSVTTTTEAYDPDTDTWTSLASSSFSRQQFASGVIDNVLYTAAGRNSSNSATDSTEKYDPLSDSWTTVTTSPTSIYQTSGVAWNGYLFMIGGDNGSNNVDDVYRYDPDTDSWGTQGNTMPSNQDESFSVVGANGIWNLGGENHGMFRYEYNTYVHTAAQEGLFAIRDGPQGGKLVNMRSGATGSTISAKTDDVIAVTESGTYTIDRISG